MSLPYLNQRREDEMLGWRVPDPDEAMLIAGGKVGEDAPFKVVTGKGAWVMPGLRHVSFLSLQMREAEIEEDCVTSQGIEVGVRAVIAFKVGNNPEAIVAAGQRFLSDESQMETLVGRIFAGHLRNIVGAMTVEGIIKERQKLADEVVQGSAVELTRLGLVVDALQIQSIDDRDSGYIKNMAAPHNAAIQRDAQIAQAEATRAASEAEQAAARSTAEYERDTNKTKAEYAADVNEAQATASQAGPLAEATAQKEVVQEQTALAKQKAELRQQELESEVIKPAEAKAKQTKILAEAEAEQTTVLAAAAASNDRVALDRMQIEQLPAIAKEVAAGLAGAHLTVLNGADGLATLSAGIAAQGMQIFEQLKAAAANGNGHGNGNGTKATGTRAIADQPQA